MDDDKSGDIEIIELKKAYQHLNDNPLIPYIDDEKIDEILEKVDHDKNGLIEYSEFLAHSLSEKHLNRVNLESFFKLMLPATNDNNVINAGILEQYFLRSGKRISLEKIKILMDECSETKGFNGRADVDFETFYHFMTRFLVSN
jgi:Ca2+-binding EF-hand superfamily protein